MTVIRDGFDQFGYSKLVKFFLRFLFYLVFCLSLNSVFKYSELYFFCFFEADFLFGTEFPLIWFGR